MEKEMNMEQPHPQPPNNNRVPSSFRDPNGFLFSHEGTLYRQVQKSYQNDYDLLMRSGLYQELVRKRLLIPHKEINHVPESSADVYKVIQPERIPFISYPYEWSFGELKDAALLTLEVQKIALIHGMSLKDASAFNIQFRGSEPVFIDTLSFERFQEGKPWVAYRQFCQHFLAPLCLMRYTDVHLGKLSQVYLDGVPLELASKLLPRRTFLWPSLLMHIHMHARYQQKYADTSLLSTRPRKMGFISMHQMQALLEHLKQAVSRLYPRVQKTEWAEYYKATNYSDEAFLKKKEIVDQYIKQIQPKMVWDLGANTGVFSRVASDMGAYTVSFDIDPLVVEAHYRVTKKDANQRTLPLVLDFTNPSPAIGWASLERDSLTMRGKADLALALALIHHLAITNNVPFSFIASYFASLASYLVIEFVPKEDSNAQRLLRVREDIFPHYTREKFEEAFSEFFTIEGSVAIPGSKRIVYGMRTRAY